MALPAACAEQACYPRRMLISVDSERPTSGHTFPVGSVFRAALDPVIVMGSDGRVRDWNPAAERVFGYTWEEAVGQGVAELIIPGPLRDVHRSGLKRHLETGETTILDRR